MCRKIAQAIATLAIITLLPVSILLYDIENTMLEPQFWEEEIEKLHGYDALEKGISERIAPEISAELIPDIWLKEQTHGLLENLFAYLKSEEDTLNLTISTKGLKDRERIDEILEKQVDRHIEEMNYLPEYKEAAKKQLMKELEAKIDSALAEMPETIDLAEGYDNRHFEQTREQVTKGIRITRIMQAASMLLLVIGIVLSGARIRWLSKVLFLTGVSLLLVGLIVNATLDSAFESANAPELAKQLVSDMFGKIIEKTNPQGGLLAGIGTLLFLGSRYGKKETTTEPAKANKPETEKTKPAKAENKKEEKKKTVKKKATKQAASRNSNRPAKKATLKKRKTSRH